MKRARRLVLSLLAVASAACVSSSKADQAGAAPAAGASTGSAAAAVPSQAQPGAAPNGVFEKTGVLAPSEFASVSIWPEAYSGSLLVLEVVPHGSTVAEGDVIAKLDTVAIDDEIHRAELEMQSATIRHAGVVEKNKLDTQAAQTQLDFARSGATRAQRSLEGWKTFELAAARRADEISKRYEEANVEDQVDELDQLEKMYNNDALVSATEDIVIKRSKRQLALTKDSSQLSSERKRYRQDFELAMQTEQKEEALRAANEALARLALQVEIDARARQDAELRSAEALKDQSAKLEKLRRDRERLIVRAPRAGVLLHGASKDYRPGKTPARYERGSQLAFRQELFVTADPRPAAVSLDLSDSELSKLTNGAALKVQTLGATQIEGKGSARIDSYPRSSSPNDVTYEARVVLDEPLSGAVYGSRAKVTVTGKPQG